MINNVTLVGRLTADPELKYSQSGVGIANFRIAVNRNFTNQQGEREADFINCVAFRKTGELIAEYMTKGSMIGVQGRVQSRRYENSEGRNVNVTEIVVEQQQFLDNKGGGQKQNSGQATNNNNNNNNDDKFGGEPIEISDSDLPF